MNQAWSAGTREVSLKGTGSLQLLLGVWLLERGDMQGKRKPGMERDLARAPVAPVYGLDTLLTKGDGGRDAVGFPEQARAGLGWVNFR